MAQPVHELYGTIPKEEYACIRCKYCGAIYRWGRRHLWQSSCMYCGCIDFNPTEVTRQEYFNFLAEIGGPEAMQEYQQMLWNPQLWKP